MTKRKNKSILFQSLLLFIVMMEIIIPVKSSIKNTTSSISIDYLERKPVNAYIIGAGDSLRITVSRNISLLNSVQRIDTSGYISLPRLNRVFVSGLTVQELVELLNKKYAEFVYDPEVEVIIEQYRAVRVLIDGEVESPGLYTLAGSFFHRESTRPLDEQYTDRGITNLLEPKSNLETGNINTDPSTTIFYPTIFDALRKAGGITSYSDISRLEVIRKNPLSNGGGKVRTKINFLNFIAKGDSSQNIRLYDGDIISVKKSPTDITKQLSKAIKSNLNPKWINVFITGRVKQQGTTLVSKSSTLNEGLDAAGGKKIISGKIIFIRFNNDGTLDKRKFSFSPNSKRGSYKNPYLKSGDIIRVGRNAINIANEILQDVTAPFVDVYSTYKIFD